MLNIKYLLIILLLGFIWSPTFLVIRIAVVETSPVIVTFLRCLSGALFLLLFAKIRKEHIRLWKKLLFSSFIGMAFPFVLCAFGEIYVDSSTAGIIESTTPIFILLFAFFFFQNTSSINKEQTFGILMGFIGIIVIFYPTLGFKGLYDFIGMASVLLMAVCFAISFLYAQKHLKHIPPVTSACLHLGFAALILLPFSLFLPWTFSRSIFMMAAFLGIFGTAFGWLIFFWLIRRIDVSYVSLATMLCPIFCIYWGYLFLQEEVTWNKLVGMGIILTSVFLMEERWSAKLKSFLQKTILEK